MIKNLNPILFDFIDSHLETDIKKLALTKNPLPEYDWKWILNQIAAKQKAKLKLPSWYNTKKIIYPSTVSIEQTSSEIISKYKSSLFTGKNIIDLTGGYGVDAYYFSKRFDDITHCEWNDELSQIVNYNAPLLGIQNMQFVSGNSIDYLKNTSNSYDYIYIDPARRDQNKNKVFLFKDCEPNVVEHMDLFFSKTDKILIKSSPLIDLNQGIQELKFVEKIIIISYKNEVKELLWLLNKKKSNHPIQINSIALENEKSYTFEHDFEDDVTTKYSTPQNYLYEPFSAVMKTGLFNVIANKYGLNKLQKHSHLYTSEKLVENFPGRIFKIDKVIPYQKNELKNNVLCTKMNVTTRNFPLTVDDLRKKHKIKDGGNQFTFFTTNNENEKIVIITSKI